MIAGSNWNRDAVTSIVLTSPLPASCRAHTAADVAPMASRKTIACLFKTASFDQMRPHLNPARRETAPQAIGNRHVDCFQRRKRSPTGNVFDELRWSLPEIQARGQPPGCPMPIQN
jgi:hypothetical protein